MPTLEIWLEYASTYSYLTVSRVGALARERGVLLDWQPFWMAPLREQIGMGAPFPHASSKAAYMWRDLERRAHTLGLPYRKPEQYPVNSLQTIRVALVAARQGWCQAFTEEAFRLHWTEGVLIGTEANLHAALGKAGQDPAVVLPLASSPGNKEALKAQTARAIERGIFGSPSFVVGGELFWGDDRLEDALDWAVAQGG
ncbi:2-hydroxychromene-2-carboxylate isomerase [Caenimonas sedimenti]|uniref:2-hydroxychromene-2-carboxylate isomerase n=1 Tax=Caenimonas sedimenti TaxID=2596921 RepID=A0A562ZEQ9_9BURK|nr:2-hydroxychromene-2-carboxylate isomerase [Caenimonas sedimenti]TWO64919.1 2-hydroxychromene-2-carboxylate isomerase [Caenimonas sedimenti]